MATPLHSSKSISINKIIEFYDMKMSLIIISLFYYSFFSCSIYILNIACHCLLLVIFCYYSKYRNIPI